MTPHLVYQLFTGRSEQASRITHKGNVFDRLTTLDWKQLPNSSINWIYLLGIFNHQGPLVVTSEQGKPVGKERLPSPFAITDHEHPDPDLGTDQSLSTLISTLHQANIKVLSDFVPNHTSFAHSWYQSHPDFYVQGVTEFSGDVCKLNYNHPELRTAMINILLTIESYGFDGVRCDMAHLIPTDFWHEAIKKVRQVNPYFVFIAEAYSNSVFNWQPLEELLAAGFNAVYDGFLYHNIQKVFSDNQPLNYLSGHLNYCLSRNDRHSFVHYLANHDDSLSKVAPHYHQALTCLLSFMSGWLLIPNGMLYGKKDRIKHHSYDVLPDLENELLSIPDWFTHIQTFINTLKPQPLSITTTDDFFMVDVEINNHRGVWIANLGNQPKSLPKQYNLLTPGLLFSHKGTDVFNPGSYELFFCE